LLLENLAALSNHNDEHSIHSDEGSGNGEDFFIPMALDPNPAPGPPPLARRENHDLQRSPPQAEEKLERPERPNARDHFAPKNAHIRRTSLERERENFHKVPSADSNTGSRNSSQPASPHIAYQERGRQLSTDFTEYVRKRKDHGDNSINAIAKDSPREIPASEPRSRRNGDAHQNGKFMLQEAPKPKKLEKKNSRSDAHLPMVDTVVPSSASRSAPVSANTQVKEQEVTLPSHESPASSRSDATLSGSPRGSRSHTSTDSPGSHSSPLSTQLKTLPERGDSLAPKTMQPPPNRRDIEAGIGSKLSTTTSNSENEKPLSAPASTAGQNPALTNASGNRGPLRSQESPPAGNFDTPPPPLRAKERLAHQGGSSSDSFVTPRAPPYPPAHRKHDSLSTPMRNGDPPTSPKLPQRGERGDLYAEDEMARGFGQEGLQDQGGFLRRVSHSVRHARSYSDRGIRLSKEQKWPKSPLIGGHSPSFGAHDISSPMTPSPDTREEILWFKSELRRERQRNVEKEQRLMELEVALEAKSSIKQMNSELREKRSTMVVLDTQKEIVVRELEVLTDHIAAAKKSGEPLDVGKMTNAVLREFAEQLQQLKDSFAPQIEDLTQRRNEMLEETSNLSQLKDKSFQEFEQLSLKNAQLADLNNQLVHQIQELYKANAGPTLDTMRPPPSALGIYAHSQRDRNIREENRDSRPSIADSNMTGSTVVPDQDTEPATYLSAPQVVNIRKAQPKKFNWKKGGRNVAQGVTKGLKGAFSSDATRGQPREGQYTEGIPYGAMSQQEYPSTTNYTKNQVQQDRGPGFGGFFGNPNKARPGQQWNNSPNNSYPSANSNEGIPGAFTPSSGSYALLIYSTALFGSELEHRAEYERSNIPGVVMRCIQEVDARGTFPPLPFPNLPVSLTLLGIDCEGIYRKSGGNSQIQAIKEGFERTNEYDISDPDLDINAVTSTLKQYFRKLPTPLITYDVYDRLLETAAAAQNGETDPSHPAHPSNPNNHAYRVSSMRHAINELPPHHRDTLEVLVFHLARVIERERENLMTSLNVAVVFAPTIMRPESLAREMQDTQAKNAAVQFLIENCQGVFLGGGRERGESE